MNAFLLRLTRRLLLALLPIASPLLCQATTVIAPDFDSLVNQAEYIVRGTVKSVKSVWREKPGQKAIITFVEIEVAETITGTPPKPLILEMLGGQIGEDRLVVEGAPEFKVGEEHIVFVRGNGRTFSPLVGVMHGQYPIKKDPKTGKAFVARSDGSPLADPQQVASPMKDAHGDDAHSPVASASPKTSTSSAPLSPSEFSSRIRSARQKARATK